MLIRRCRTKQLSWFDYNLGVGGRSHRAPTEATEFAEFTAEEGAETSGRRAEKTLVANAAGLKLVARRPWPAKGGRIENTNTHKTARVLVF